MVALSAFERAGQSSAPFPRPRLVSDQVLPHFDLDRRNPVPIPMNRDRVIAFGGNLIGHIEVEDEPGIALDPPMT